MQWQLFSRSMAARFITGLSQMLFFGRRPNLETFRPRDSCTNRPRNLEDFQGKSAAGKPGKRRGAACPALSMEANEDVMAMQVQTRMVSQNFHHMPANFLRPRRRRGRHSPTPRSSTRSLVMSAQLLMACRTATPRRQCLRASKADISTTGLPGQTIWTDRMAQLLEEAPFLSTTQRFLTSSAYLQPLPRWTPYPSNWLLCSREMPRT
mmetsp:Transcript_59476/g.128630  ORF Transcript_59476/g.128630 Transcript_59476/m.128630 type:complete len:208 (+) Transcript_59476:1088-1711(+)